MTYSLARGSLRVLAALAASHALAGHALAQFNQQWLEFEPAISDLSLIHI